MKDLIEKLAQADGPSRELDWEIHLRNGLQSVGMYGDHPRYTASIDAAVTLVPEGVEFNTDRYVSSGVYPDNIRASAWVFGAPRAFAPTPALALCIAALSAKEPSQ